MLHLAISQCHEGEKFFVAVVVIGCRLLIDYIFSHSCIAHSGSYSFTLVSRKTTLKMSLKTKKKNPYNFEILSVKNTFFVLHSFD